MRRRWWPRLGAEAAYDWGGGLVWLLMPQGGRDLRARLAGRGGPSTLMRAGPAAITGVAATRPSLAAIGRGLKRQFDPRGILNPGLMG
jgi:glycolate oxidase FAD binding subunit